MSRIKSLVCIVLMSFWGLQGMAQYTLLPIDEHIRYGKLPNGLTYYIRSNKEPRGLAEFWIAHRVGSMQEEDNQKGLAHFLEHMAFNGSKHFHNQSMIKYLEKEGVKFGTNLNAYTSFEQTVYNISDVPTKNANVLDSCLLILRDWCGDLDLTSKDIEKERKVIIEEWRTRNTASYRAFKSLVKQMYPNSKYADRFPIGDTAVIMHFSRKELYDYYKAWYRPDLQAIVIVGDFNALAMEKKVIELFSNVSTMENPPLRRYENVANNREHIVAIASDKEVVNTTVSIAYKHKSFPEEAKPTLTYFMYNYMTEAISYMLNARFSEIIHKPSSPFITTEVYDGNFLVSPKKGAFNVSCSCKDTEITLALQSMLIEILRASEYGFTSTEYERAKREILRSVQSAYNERQKCSNRNYVSEYVDHFLNGGYIPGIEKEYELYNRVVPDISVDKINDLYKRLIGERNVVVSVCCPEKKGFVPPTKEQLATIFDLSEDWGIEPYKDIDVTKPLIAKKVKKGSIVKSAKEKDFDVVRWVLSNGANVLWKKTDFRQDEILIAAVSRGGSSLIKPNRIAEIKTFDGLISVGGMGDFSSIELQKVLAGKEVNLSFGLNLYSEGMSASCSPRDLETMMQLIYLGFSQPKKDVDAYTSYLKRLGNSIANEEANPMTAYKDSLNKVLYDGDIRTARLTSKMIKSVNYDEILKIHKERFGNPHDFTFVIVGNIDEKTLHNLVETYIASIPKRTEEVLRIRENWVDLKLYPQKGTHSLSFKKKMNAPKVTITSVYSGTMKNTLENRVISVLLQNILTKVYRDKIREEKGGTYGVYVNSSFYEIPDANRYTLSISFNTNVQQEVILRNIVHSELRRIANNGPSVEDLENAKKYIIKQHKQNLKENFFWLNLLKKYALYNTNDDVYTEFATKDVSVEAIKNFVTQLLSQNNLSEVIMEPEIANGAVK